MNKPIIISKNNMDKFEEKEFKKEEKIVKKDWYVWHNWLIKYIPGPIKNRE